MFTSDQVVEFEKDLRIEEGRLELLAKKICDVRGGAPSWQHLNQAIVEVQEALHNAYMMDELQQ